MKILMNFPQVNKAVVQSDTDQCVVDYAAMTCTCRDHSTCQHIRFVLGELARTEDKAPGIECDDCHMVKPETAFEDPGHTAGGSCQGFDLETDVCADCARKDYEKFMEDLYESAAAEIAEEKKLGDGGSAPENLREYIAPLIVGDRWVYWLEQEQPEGTIRGDPAEFPQGVKAWRTDQAFIGGEQMTGIVTEMDEGRLITFRSAIVRVSTPTRAQYDAWRQARGELMCVHR